MHTVRTIGSFMLAWGALSTSAFGGTRVFMARDADVASVAATGNTEVVMAAGTTERISIWIEDNAQSQQLAAYTAIVRWEGVPSAGASGTVTYVDNAPFPGGDSIGTDTGRADFVFFSEDIFGSLLEVPPPPAGDSGFGTGNLFSDPTGGISVPGLKYLGHFDIAASPGACGSFEFTFVPFGGKPQGGSQFAFPPDAANPGGGPFVIDEFQSLTVVVGEAVVHPGDMCLSTLGYSDSFDIPAGFFSATSAPFNGPINFSGSLALPFDTKIRLKNGAAFCGPLPDPVAQSIDIEIVALSLVSVAPVEIDGVFWNVFGSLSANGALPIGSMSLDAAGIGGGTFSATWPLQPKYTFVDTADPSHSRTWDTGAPLPPGTPALQPKLMITLVPVVWSTPDTFTPSNPNFPAECLTTIIVESNGPPLDCCNPVFVTDIIPGGGGHNVSQAGCVVCGSGQAPSGACCSAGTVCQIVPGAAFCPDPDTYFGDGSTCVDSDKDGIPDVLETNDNCANVSSCNTGTNPANQDTDGDGCGDLTDPFPCDPCLPSGGCNPLGSDCNDNGVNDTWEAACGGCADCDNDGICRECDTVWCCVEDPAGLIWIEATEALCQAVAGTSPLTIYDECCDPPTQGAEPANEGGLVFNHAIGTPGVCPATCLAPPVPESHACPPPVFIDPWRSGVQDGATVMCEDFSGDPANSLSPPLPANFFGQRNNIDSDTWVGKICFEGDPLSPPATQFGEFGTADTLIKRTVDPYDRCALPGAPVSVSVEIAALNLLNSNRVTVTWGCTACAAESDPVLAEGLRTLFCATPGNVCEEWDVVVGLSNTVPTPGVLTATKLHCNGGTYFNTLNVQALLTFNKIGEPGVTATLDTGAAGFAPVQLEVLPAEGRPWSSDIDSTLGLGFDEPAFACSDFHPGIDTLTKSTNCDCNLTGQRDLCDIEQFLSADCNVNGIPDECEIAIGTPGGTYFCAPGAGCDLDCNANGIPDSCETDCNLNGVPDECDILSATSNDCNTDGIPDDCQADCNGNGLADDCDIAGTSNDCNGNGIPDECEQDCNANGLADSCEIANGTAQDANGNGIPDPCELGATACFTASSCCDVTNVDGVRDDVCSWCSCNAGACNTVARAVPSDMGGAFGDCTLDGFCNLADALHALSCFSNDNACDSINIDAGGAFGDCAPDGFCNLADALHALSCFSGDNTCGCGPLPGTPFAPNIVGATTLHAVADRRTARPGDTVQVRVFMTEAIPSFKAYQLHVEASGGRTGSLDLVDIAIEDRRDSVLAGTANAFDAFNVANAQMTTGLFTGSVATKRMGYLATFIYRVAHDATGTFVIDILHDDTNQDQTFLVGAEHTDKIEIAGTQAAVITVVTGSARSIR